MEQPAFLMEPPTLSPTTRQTARNLQEQRLQNLAAAAGSNTPPPVLREDALVPQPRRLCPADPAQPVARRDGHPGEGQASDPADVLARRAAEPAASTGAAGKALREEPDRQAASSQLADQVKRKIILDDNKLLERRFQFFFYQ